MKNDEFKLHLFKPLVFLVVLVVVISYLFFILTTASENRKRAVYGMYAPETERYINKNKQGLVKIFKELFPNQVCSSSYQVDCKLPGGDQIASLISQDLKDWSSIMFVKWSGDRILYMRLSGDAGELYVNSDEKRNALKDLLTGREETIPWDDYTHEFTQKEIVVPVKDGDKVIGGVIRGIIE